jgi:shikimate kinase
VAASLPRLDKLHFGASTHNRDEWTSIDKACGHAGVGPVRATATKQNHDEPIGFEGLQEGCSILREQGVAPIAIGGLGVDDALPCFQAGAESLAMAKALSPNATTDGELTEFLWQAQKIKYSQRPLLNGKRGVLIVGGSGAGKTALAESMAPLLGLEAIDLDLRIAQNAGKSIREIFGQGEAVFREMESKALPKCMEKPAVVALGAGAWQQETVRRYAEKSSWDVVWLAENPQTAWERVKNDPSRPLAQDRSGFMQRWRSRMALWSELPTLLPLGKIPDELARVLCSV